MDERKDKAAWDSAILRFKASYPGQYFDADNAKSYRTTLLFFDINDVVEGLNVAVREHPKKMPFAGIVRDIVCRVKRERGLRSRVDAAEEVAYQNPAPADPVKATEYVDAAEKPFERFARKIEAESRRLGLSPNEPTPPEIHKRRMAEFWQIWKETHGGGG